MKNQLNKNIALEDSHNREVVAGCYVAVGKSSARFLFLERGLKIGRGNKKNGLPKKSGLPPNLGQSGSQNNSSLQRRLS